MVIVGGCGHVGLPLGLIFCEYGYQVSLLDSNIHSIDLVSSGVMPFVEPGCDELLKKHISNKCLRVTSDLEIIRDSLFVVIVIGTALNMDNQPDLDGIHHLFDELAVYLTSDHIVILRSTVYPGTTESLQKKFPHLRILFCPERIAEGFALKELVSIPQILGSSNNHFADLQANELFSSIGVKVLSTSSKVAELVKLLSNAWRYITFGVVNEIHQLLETIGIDSPEVFELMKFEYPRADSLPFPGFTGGPCLPKDTRQINHFFENRFLFASAAMAVHDSFPASVVRKLRSEFNLDESTVGVLGVSFKPDSDDTRGSQAILLIQQLRMFAKAVVFHDPFLKKSKDNLSREEILKKSDLIVVATRHKHFEDLAFSRPVIYI